MMKLINGWIRLWVWGVCPECNSDAPKLYTCPICEYYKYVPRYKTTKSQKKIAWKRFKLKSLKEKDSEAILRNSLNKEGSNRG